MKSFIVWFQNHSLRFKMVVLLFGVVFVFQIINGFVFTSIVSEKFGENISESNLATVKQMSINLNQAMEDIVNEMIPIRDEILSHQLITEGEESRKDYISQNIAYQGMFNRLIAADGNYQFINSMLILNKSNRNHTFVLNAYLHLKNEDLFQKILDDNELSKQCQWGEVLCEDYFFTGNKEQIISIIMPVYRYGEIKDLLIVNLKVEAIRRYLEKLDGAENFLLLQLGKGDAIVTNYKEGLSPEKELLDAVMASDNEAEVFNAGSNVVMSSSLEINSWRLSMVTAKSSINSGSKVLSQFIISIIFTTGIVLLISISYIVFIITKPIKRMTEIMEANRHTKQINHRFHPRYRDDVGVLADTYNHLMDEIQQLLADIEKEQVENRKVYLKMLQLQIKPHFLYNTLEAAKFLVEMKDPQGIEMLTAIGKFYKLSLSGIYDRVKVEEEIEHLTCYLQILKMRYSSKYDYSIEVDEGILDSEIIKFTLQPLVENAVYHGIKQQRRKGYIKVYGYRDKQDVVIAVWDDGVGIEENQLKEIQSHLKHAGSIQAAEHIGIINVHQRIQMQYGKSYGLRISSREGEYTQVEVRLPGTVNASTVVDRGGLNGG